MKWGGLKESIDIISSYYSPDKILGNIDLLFENNCILTRLTEEKCSQNSKDGQRLKVIGWEVKNGIYFYQNY